MRGMFGIENTSDEEACKWFIEQFDLRYLILTGGATFSTIMSNDGEVSTLATPHVTVADTVAPATRSPAPSPAAFSTATPSASHTAQP